MSNRLKEFVNKISQVKSGTEIEEFLKEFLEYDQTKIIRCNNCGGELQRSTYCHVVTCQKCLKEIKIEALRDAAKAICKFCESPTKEKCSVAKLIHGNWDHDSTKQMDRIFCKAGEIHELIMEIENE